MNSVLELYESLQVIILRVNIFSFIYYFDTFNKVRGSLFLRLRVLCLEKIIIYYNMQFLLFYFLKRMFVASA